MEVDRKNIVKKVCVGVALYCFLAPHAFATLAEPLKHDELKLVDKNIAGNVRESSSSLVKKTPYHSSDYLRHNKHFALVDSMNEDGQLFFEMRSRHLLASESSAATLLLLGFFGFFTRRWI